MSTKYSLLELGERIKYIRKRLSISQKEMANRLGIAISTYQYYERGEREVPSSILFKLTTFGFDSRWLLLGEGEPYLKNDKVEGLIPNEAMESLSGFSDRQRALSINRELIELEKLDSETFIRVESYIKGALDTIRGIRKVTPYNGPERRKGQRRIQAHPDQIPDGQDRRTGEDRRKVSGGSR